MTINLNAFPITIPEGRVDVCEIPFDARELEELREQYRTTHTFYRQKNSILIFSSDGSYPVSGRLKSVDLKENYNVLCFLFKDGLLRYLRGLGRKPLGFKPIELLSTRPDDNILKSIIRSDYPFSIFARYKLDTRIIYGVPNLIIDCSTKTVVTKNCEFFIENGFDLHRRFIAKENDDGYRKIIGVIERVENKTIFYSDGNEVQEVRASEVYLEASRKNFDDYLKFSNPRQFDSIAEKIRVTISSFNSGENKRKKIIKLFEFLKSKGVHLISNDLVNIEVSPNIGRKCAQFDKPVFVFNDGGEADWAERGFTRFGPYTKRTFDRNDPSICVICLEQNKGQVEQFVRKFVKGIHQHKYFSGGLEGKFSLGTSRVEVFTTKDESVDSYKNAIERAIQKKAQDNEKWDLAIVQVRESFKSLSVDSNPYYVGKNIFFLHQIPVQDFTMELLLQNDNSLGYSLNNMALASYAKMGGVPWLLKSSPTLSHELVIGIGSATLQDDRFSGSRRVMGITTVFSGDGSYLVSNTSKVASPEEYCDALTTVLSDTIEKIQSRMNWLKGDTIRIVFHASVKVFNKEEIRAVRAVIDRYSDYNVEYAFLKISEFHGLHMFDSASSSERKGKYAPPRGKYLKLSDYEVLAYLIGKDQLKQASDGHPQGLILNVHRDSTFKDIKYLSTQLFNFSSHSWRSYFPSPMPVTISYSDLIAKNLGWLNKLPGWNGSVMIGKIGQTQWFL
ncbi:argonaute/piwi family protein [Aliikangiella maris]|uniref:Piwi domain-containing protein n=2 Tax=Aliikangiella maris TaxID=3162458 RepID=A0ABV2C0T9_9GAMM